MTWKLKDPNITPVLYLEMTGGFHAFTDKVSTANGFTTKQDADDFKQLFSENLVSFDDGITPQTWVLTKDGTSPLEYLCITNGRISTSTNINDALQFANMGTANRVRDLMAEAYSAIQQ